MIKQFGLKLFLALSFLSAIPLSADYDSTMQVRAGAFMPTSNRFKKVYGDNFGTFQAEASIRLHETFRVWTNFEWLSRKGHSYEDKYPTRINISNVSFGVKNHFLLGSRYSGYLGIVAVLSGIQVKNKSSCGTDKDSRLVLGGVFKSGIIYALTENVFFDLFVDYTYQPTNFPSRVNAGGLKTGLGVGLWF